MVDEMSACNCVFKTTLSLKDPGTNTVMDSVLSAYSVERNREKTSRTYQMYCFSVTVSSCIVHIELRSNDFFFCQKANCLLCIGLPQCQVCSAFHPLR